MKNIKEPTTLFSEWYNQEIKVSKTPVPSVVCLSTIGIDNFPNARFVSFKELVDDAFVITGSLNSRKGIEVDQNENVALTFWWPETQRQVRIQGIATIISDQLANKYFNERSTNAQAVSSICQQGIEMDNIEWLEKKISEVALRNEKIQRPNHWSGFLIRPIRIEFMEFKTSRFHHRKLYLIENGEWAMKQIQP